MNYLTPAPEKINSVVPFHGWDGRLLVADPCGGWRPATRLEAVMLQQPRGLVILRDLED